MRGRLLIGAVVGLAMASAVGAEAGPVAPTAEHQSAAWDDCLFTSWYDETSPSSAGGTLTAAADVRCSQPGQMEVDVAITDGVGDTAAVGGPSNPLVGVGFGPSAGLPVWSGSNWDTSDAQVVGVVPAPPAGHVYSVVTIAKFSDACAVFQCDPPPPPPPAGPSAPGSAAPGSTGGLKSLIAQTGASTCYPEHDGTYDVDCEWQFTVVGRALPPT